MAVSIALLSPTAEDPVRLRTIPSPRDLSGSARVVVVDFGRGPAQVAATRAMRSRAEAILKDFANAARDTLRRMRGNRDMRRYDLYLSVRPTVSLNQSGRVSAYLEVYTFTGGARLNRWFETFTFVADERGARAVTLGDLLLPGRKRDFLDWVLLPALNELKADRGASPASMVDDRALNSFVATRSALVWLFSPYAVGAYAEGAYVVKLPLEKLGGYVQRTHPLLQP